MFNKYKYQYILQVEVESSLKDIRHSWKTEYAGSSFDEIDGEFRKDCNIPEDFKLKSEFEYNGNLFRLRYLYWDSRKDVFDPFDEWEEDE